MTVPTTNSGAIPRPPPAHTESTEAGLSVILGALIPPSMRNTSWSTAITASAALGAVAPVAAALWGLIGKRWFGLGESGVQKVLLFIVVVELLALLATLFPIFRLIERSQTREKLQNSEAHDATQGVIRSLQNIVLSWIGLYFLFAVDASTHLFGAIPRDGRQVILDLLSDALNLVSAYWFLHMWLHLGQPSDSKHVGQQTFTARTVHALLILSLFLSIYLRITATQGLQIPVVSPDAAKVDLTYVQFAQTLNGLLTGLTMALVFGRLESRFLGLAGGVVWLLFLYSLIQPAFPWLFADRHVLRLPFLAAAFLLKIVFIAAVVWAAEGNGKEPPLRFYMRQVRYLHYYITKMRQRSRDSVAIGPVPIVWTGEATFDARHRLALQLCVRNTDVADWWMNIEIDGVQIGATKFDVRILRNRSLASFDDLNQLHDFPPEVRQGSLSGEIATPEEFRTRMRSFVETEQTRAMQIELDLDADLGRAEIEQMASESGCPVRISGTLVLHRKRVSKLETRGEEFVLQRYDGEPVEWAVKRK